MEMTNIMGIPNCYYASVRTEYIDYTFMSWGLSVSKKHGNLFTIELANKILDFANTEFKKGLPEGYYAKAYDPTKDFTYIELDMSSYIDKGPNQFTDHLMTIIGKEKIGKYDKTKNRLIIFEDGVPIYENNNGIICRDSVALSDSLYGLDIVKIRK